MMKNDIDVKLVNKRELAQRLTVFKLRYHIYSHHLNHNRSDLNHEQQLLTDALDDKSAIFLAEINSLAVGTVRMTELNRLSAEENVLMKHHHFSEPSDNAQESALLSLFCILPDYHQTPVTRCLVRTLLMYAVKKNIKQLFLEAPDYLFSYYQLYQFTQCSDWVKPEGCPVFLTAMTINTDALTHFLDR